MPILMPINVKVSNAPLVIFRILFGLLMSLGSLRFILNGWIEELYVKPTYFFKYWGFEWVSVPKPFYLYALFIGIVISGLCIALGFFYRFNTILFLALFLYSELLDVTNYLNHYYLASILTLFLCFLPAAHRLSLDVYFKRLPLRKTMPMNIVYLFRFQLFIVYFYAALAKFQTDWLLYAQPMNIWLYSRTDWLMIEWLKKIPYIDYVFSWGGFLYDLTIPLFLSIKKIRPFAYMAVLIFHAMTALLFDIGLFPYIMSIATLWFFSPKYLEQYIYFIENKLETKLENKLKIAPQDKILLPDTPKDYKKIKKNKYTKLLAQAAVSLFIIIQILFPLRHYYYSGNVLWNERGMRYAWKVMVREKNGSPTFFVGPNNGNGQSAEEKKNKNQLKEISPFDYMTKKQVAEMSSQPDLIIQFGKYLGGVLTQKYNSPVSIYVEAKASLNGRKGYPLIHENCDLVQVDDGIMSIFNKENLCLTTLPKDLKPLRMDY